MTGMTNALPPKTTLSHRLFGLMLLISLLAFNTLATAESPTRQYNIPAGSLAHALNNLAEHSDLQVIYDTGLTQGLSSQGLKGNYSTAAALQKLLSGTGLVYSLSDGEVTIRAADKTPKPFVPVANPSPGNPEPMSESTLPKVTVEADADNPYDDPTWQTDPYNTDYVLPKATAGTKTDTPVMETPLNVQVISKQVLKDQQVISINKALRNVSGVTTNKSSLGLESFFLRGFGTETIFRNGFRMDGGSFSQGQQFANVESIEVLKGPAAILYGRVEPGGMVNIVTKQPRATPYYSFNQQFGSYDLYRTSIDATGPLTKDDTLLYRVNASFQSNNSFRDLVSGEDIFFAPILKWNISPRTQATLEMEYNRSLTSADNQVLPLVGAGTAKQHIKELPHSWNLGERNPIETENIFVGLNWSHQFDDDWSIKHQVAFKRQDTNLGANAIPIDFGEAPYQGINLNTGQVDRYVSGSGITKFDTVATNLDLTGHFNTWGLEHTLLFGGDYYNFDYFDTSTNGIASTINLGNIVHPGPGVTSQPITFHIFRNTDFYGLYLQDQIKLPYNLHVMGGLRYQYVHATENDASPPSTVLSPQPSLTDDAVTPRVGLLWQPKNWLSLYSNYVESFGINQPGATQFGGFTASGVPNPKVLPSTSAQQWEIGTKTEFFDGRLRATFAYYDLRKQNTATSDRDLAHTCGGTPGDCFIALGEVRSRGPEVDIQGEILPGWNIIATYTYQDVRVSKSNDAQGDNKVGNRLGFTPRNIGSFWSTYEVQKGDLKGFKIGGGVTMQDSTLDNSNTFKSPGYVLVSISAGYGFDVGKAKINLQLNVDNLLNKSYFANASPDGNLATLNFSTPRTFMGSINVEY